MALLSGGRGQSAAEFVLVLGAIIAVVVAVMARAYVENDLTIGFAAARLGAAEAVASDPALSLAAIDYTVSGRNVTLQPRIFSNSAPIGDRPAIRSAMLGKIRDSLSPQSPVPSTNFSTLFHDYYVSFP